MGEPQHLGELMRTARALSGSPSLRVMEQRAADLDLRLSRSTLGEALRMGAAVPTERVFCGFMQMISGFAGSPASRYGAAVWEELWKRAVTGRCPQAVVGPSSAAPAWASPAAASAAEGSGRSTVVRRGRGEPPRVWVRPGPLRELRDWLHGLLLKAGKPSMAEVAEAVRLDDSLESAPGKGAVSRLLRSSTPGALGDTVAVAVVLARMAGENPVTVSEKARDLWVRAKAEAPYGIALSEVADPLALGVHKAFTVQAANGPLPVLPPYVRREHDHAIGEAVRRTVDGQSAMVLARGHRATGTTRTCWEALREVPGTWRFWSPADPSRFELVVEAISQAGPNSVVWLDRIERFLDPAQCHLAGDVHAELRELLHDPGRAPVLVIGTVSADAGVLTRANGQTPGTDAAVRTLIEDSAVDVPNRFTADELALLADTAGRDPRLALASAEALGAVARFLSTDRSPSPLIEPQNFRTAVDQGDTHTLLMGGALLQQSGRLGEAAIWYQRAAEAGDAQALEPAAAMLSENGTSYEAVRWLRMLAEAGDADAAVTAARRLLREGRDDEAVEHYRLAAVIDGTSRTLRPAAALLRRTGQVEQAVRWLRDLAAQGNPVALREAAHLLWEEGDTTRSLRFYAEAGSAGDLEAWRDAAEHLQGLGRDDEAIMMYQAAVNNGDELSILPLADLLATVGQQDKALEIYIGAAEKKVETPGEGKTEVQPNMAAIRRAAALYRLTERPDEALHWFRKATEYGDMTAYMQIGLILRGKCDIAGEAADLEVVDGAVTAFTKAAAVGERHAHREAAWILLKYRGWAAAAAWLQSRVTAGDRRALREMADFLRETGRTEQALEWYAKAAEQGSRSSASHVLRIRAQGALGGAAAERLPGEGAPRSDRSD
ncbi:tetratricopeptide repeat protein [Kitasatospora sp. NPDC017646]|uniref:tetratricopeptide repeat protein n=1 Tax=Kitasatospora sp. NPDC017646 TaxID=3364024 RepID=UPI0037A25242